MHIIIQTKITGDGTHFFADGIVVRTRNVNLSVFSFSVQSVHINYHIQTEYFVKIDTSRNNLREFYGRKMGNTVCQSEISDFNRQITSTIPLLRKLAAKYVRNEEDVQDLIQDTLYKALKNRKKFKQNSNLKGWLSAILKNTFINQYHKNKLRKFHVDIDSVKCAGESINDPVLHHVRYPFESSVRYTFSDNYNLSIKSLPRNFQTLIFLCDIEGFSYDRIAEYLGCPVDTVRTRLYRGRKNMVKKYRKLHRSEQF